MYARNDRLDKWGSNSVGQSSVLIKRRSRVQVPPALPFYLCRKKKMSRKMYQRVCCADGFEMSVQANVSAYCSPRENSGKYELVEVGFPSAVEPMLMPYVEDRGKPTKTVYGYVPVEVVTNVLAKHGGIVSGEVPPGVIAIRAS